MKNITLKALSLPLLQKMGLNSFFLFDIRSTQAFLSAHLQGSLHAQKLHPTFNKPKRKIHAKFKTASLGFLKLQSARVCSL
ncbi:hypothetical protein [Helicobacter himalayensis]|uniref:hypothetical protein n=1 Tax=Helicobacter himalayensis TaxID=1591088 RepID=UPI00082E7656|nr:hypothetical protein [Helicobacter himalayensis]